MYLGKIVEAGKTNDILNNPKHPYTIGLLNSLPQPSSGEKLLTPIPGQPPTISSIPSGCAFHPRCQFVFDRCKNEAPDLYNVKSQVEHKSRCFLECDKT